MLNVPKIGPDPYLSGRSGPEIFEKLFENNRKQTHKET